MGNQIIKQPDGHYAIFSTITNTIHFWDATADEIVEYFAEQAAKRAREDTRRVLDHVAAGEPRKAYFQFAMTWDEALRKDQEHGGEVWSEFAAPQEASET
jgi:hypothetical protein